jgi:hypothetical protein
MNVIHPVLPIYECATEPLQDATKSVVGHAAAEAATDPATEPLHSAANPTGSGAALTETFCLCVQF